MTVEIPDVKKSWPHAINAVTIGATSADGGTRTSTVTAVSYTHLTLPTN